MGNLQLFRLWLLLGSVFMLFLIILYWDEVGNAGLHLRSSPPAPPLPPLPVGATGGAQVTPRPTAVSTSTQLVMWTSEDKGYSFIWDTDAFDREVMVDPDPPETRPTRDSAAAFRARQRPMPKPPEVVESRGVPESPETTVPPEQDLEPTPTQTRPPSPPTTASTTTTTTKTTTTTTSPTTITPVAHRNPTSKPTQPHSRHNTAINTPGAAPPVPPTAPFFSLLRRQAERRRQLQEACAVDSGFDFPGKLRSFDQIPSQALDHLIVDDRHGIIYCYVPKVACTNWKRVMIVLGEKLVANGGGAGAPDDPNAAPTPYRRPQDVPSELSHNGTLHLTFNKFWRRYGKASRSLMHAKLRKYTKFLFVRDPFVRLMSAFRNKLAQPNEDFYKQFGAHMLQRYANISQPPSTAREAFKAGLRPSFADFVHYLLDPETEKEEAFNEHWRQVYRLCHPCQIGYDFIGKLETLDEDARHLLHILDVDRQIQFPPGYRNRTTASWERDWFANIPLEDKKKLYELYEPDFRLFGYSRPDTLLHE